MKKVIALLLALLMMVGILAGCTGDTEEGTSTEPTSTSSTEPTTAPSYEGPVEGEGDVTTELPLVEDTYTFDFWTRNPGSFEGFAGMQDNLFYQWMEEQTGVHMNFQQPAAGSESESFQTMILSGDYPDFIGGFKGYYTGGVDKAIEDGVLRALNDIIDQIPNYKAKVYETEETFIQSVSDEGNLWGIHMINDRPQGSWIGLGIRTDWLDEAGMTVEDVETISGLEAALTAFTDYTYDGSGPLWLAAGSSTSSSALLGSYNVLSVQWQGGFMNVDGTATYAPLADGFKDYAAQMADWYAKGLIHKDYIAAASWGTPDDRWINGEVGVGDIMYTQNEMFAASAAVSELNPDPDFAVTAITTPKLSADMDWSDIHVRNSSDKVRSGNSLGITTQCSNIELACAYWNYVWSEEGIMAANWGPVAGELGDLNAHYYIDETDANGDGHKECYQPWLIEKYGNVSNVQGAVVVANGPSWCIWSREWCALTTEQIGMTYTWDRVGDEYIWPEGVTLTADEGNSASSITANCNSSVNTWLAEVITGEKSVDTYETELVPQLKDFNIDEAVGYYQNALARYLDRIQYMEG